MARSHQSTPVAAITPLGILAKIDTDIANAQARVAQLQLVRTNILAAYHVEGPVTDAEVPAKDETTTRRRGRGSRRKKTTKADKPSRRSASSAGDASTDAVFAWLSKQKHPAAIAEVVGGTSLSKYHVKKAIKTLLNSERLDSAGIKSHYRIGIPSVMAAAAKEDL
jgi:hypothetical protein